MHRLDLYFLLCAIVLIVTSCTINGLTRYSIASDCTKYGQFQAQDGFYNCAKKVNGGGE